jgi:hypothetical protein
MTREEFRTFTCRRYREGTSIHYIYEILTDGTERLIYSSCSLQDSGYKCHGMENPGRPCPLVLSFQEKYAIEAERSSSG